MTDRLVPILRRETDPVKVLAKFSVDGEPMSKARARVVDGHAYTPEGTRVAEAAVQAAFFASGGSYRPAPLRSDVAYGMTVVFWHATRQRRDIDNMMKLICDALNGLAWTDDTQVLEISGRKICCAKGSEHTEVTIYEVPGDRGLEVACAQCGEMMRTYQSWSATNRFCSAECRDLSRRRRTCKNCGDLFRITTGRLYCSDECKRTAKRVVEPCAHCSKPVERFRSWQHNGRPFCRRECQQAYWREHRAVAARGTCGTCGGHTSKRSYQRCRACVVAGRSAVG